MNNGGSHTRSLHTRPVRGGRGRNTRAARLVRRSRAARPTGGPAAATRRWRAGRSPPAALRSAWAYPPGPLPAAPCPRPRRRGAFLAGSRVAGGVRLAAWRGAARPRPRLPRHARRRGRRGRGGGRRRRRSRCAGPSSAGGAAWVG